MPFAAVFVSFFSSTLFSAIVVISMFFLFFFFKQKTAYEMRISDWSSDVCSSDLTVRVAANLGYRAIVVGDACACFDLKDADGSIIAAAEIGRASCRERVCQYV